MAATSPTTSQAARITIRFATHQLPDLPLLISPSTRASPTRHLRAAIRPYLPSDLHNRALRLIHAGRVLNDAETIGAALRVQGWQGRSTGKGKERLPRSEDGAALGICNDAEADTTNIFTRTYIHCSISPSTLSSTELAAESALDIPSNNDVDPEQHAAFTSRRLSSADNAPRGFDRLLSTANLSHADVASLRAQFAANVNSRYTPDTMPSPGSLLAMEERWLEQGRVTQDGGVDEDDARGQMYETLLGMCTGFFWPLGAVSWGVREEGVWSRRRGLAVLAGVCVNVGFGLVRVLG